MRPVQVTLRLTYSMLSRGSLPSSGLWSETIKLHGAALKQIQEDSSPCSLAESLKRYYNIEMQER